MTQHIGSYRTETVPTKKSKVEPEGMVRCKKCASWNFKGRTCHHCGEAC